MTAADPLEPPRKKRYIFWWLLAICLSMLAVFLCQLFGPAPSLVISKETTYISGPLRPDGWPDYERYVLEQRREGITRDNNAAVLLIPALWPANLSADQYERVAAELELGEIPSAKNALQPLYSDDIKKRVLALLPPQNEADGEPDPEPTINQAFGHAWTSKQLPPLAEWVAANQKPLDVIVAASRRSRLYLPSPTLLDDQEDPLFSMLLPGAQSLREGARALALRAMLRTGEGRLTEAWQDTLAIHRLAALQMKEPCSLVEQLVAMALSGIATQNTLAILSSDHLTKELALQIQTDLVALPPFDGVPKSLDTMERIDSLDAVVFSRLHGFDALTDSTGTPKSNSPVDHAAIDWNIILKRLNYWCDRLVAAASTPRGPASFRANKQFESDISAEASRVRTPKEIILAFLSRNERSELIAAVYAGLLLPAVSAAITAEDRTIAKLELTKTAAAIAAYRVEHGTYPDKLGQLASSSGPLPVDPFNAQPFIYKRTKDGGYLLYSVGPNGQDEQANNWTYDTFEGQSLQDRSDDEAIEFREKSSKSADDLSILMPVQPFQFPAPKAP